MNNTVHLQYLLTLAAWTSALLHDSASKSVWSSNALSVHVVNY